ncbi:MAG TPA: glutaredoxin family protein [Burkholderiales bacterium]|jgi:glutaredoxin
MIGVPQNAAKSSAVLAVFLLLAAAAAGAQQMYRWTDENGRVHITDTPPPASATGVKKQAARSVPAETNQGKPYELAQAMKEFPVKLYTAPSCKDPCDQARSLLNRRGVPFKEVQVWEEDTAQDLRKLTGGTLDVPVLTVGRSVQKGFQQDAFDALLDSARYPKAGLIQARSQAAPKPPEGYTAPGAAQAEPAKPAAPAEEPRPTGPYAPRFSK